MVVLKTCRTFSSKNTPKNPINNKDFDNDYPSVPIVIQ